MNFSNKIKEQFLITKNNEQKLVKHLILKLINALLPKGLKYKFAKSYTINKLMTVYNYTFPLCYNIKLLRKLKMKQQKKQRVQINSSNDSFQKCIQNYNIFQLILITLRLLPAAALMCFVILFHDYIKPNIMVPSIKRYLASLINLISIRFVLILLGFFKFECDNYRYFDKMTSRVMTFRSGWVGVASYHNFIDFLYYSYLFNPLYTQVVEYHDDKKDSINPIKLYYTPLTFKEAFFLALNYRGFDPIIIKGEYDFKNFKRRKMLMPTLISQCFQQFNGPILIFLPNIKPKQQISLHQVLGQDIFDNQKKFSRSGIAFMTSIYQTFLYKQKNVITQMKQIPQFCDKIYPNQIIFLCKLASELKMNILSIVAIEIQKHKYQYNRQLYASFIDEQYSKNGYKIEKMSYSDYKNKFQQEIKQIEQQNDNEQKINDKQYEVL